jgi:hypothetical protein
MCRVTKKKDPAGKTMGGAVWNQGETQRTPSKVWARGSMSHGVRRVRLERPHSFVRQAGLFVWRDPGCFQCWSFSPKFAGRPGLPRLASPAPLLGVELDGGGSVSLRFVTNLRMPCTRASSSCPLDEAFCAHPAFWRAHIPSGLTLPIAATAANEAEISRNGRFTISWRCHLSVAQPLLGLWSVRALFWSGNALY